MASRQEGQQPEHEREEVYRLLLPGRAEPQQFRSDRALTPHGLSLRLTSDGGPLEGKNPDILRFFTSETEVPTGADIRQFAGVSVIRVELRR